MVIVPLIEVKPSDNDRCRKASRGRGKRDRFAPTDAPIETVAERRSSVDGDSVIDRRRPDHRFEPPVGRFGQRRHPERVLDRRQRLGSVSDALEERVSPGPFIAGIDVGNVLPGVGIDFDDLSGPHCVPSR